MVKHRARAIVIDDQDPKSRERIRVRVLDSMGHEQEVWAEPCLLYNPCGQGGYSAPPPGSEVLIEFEGDPGKPVWLGLCLS